MTKKNDIEKISLDIANYWISNNFFTESNNKCGTLVAFDWVEGYLTEINTNIDLNDLRNVDTTTVTSSNGDMIVFDAITQKFEAAAGIDGGYYG